MSALRNSGRGALAAIAVALVALVCAVLLLLAMGVDPRAAGVAAWSGTFGTPSNLGLTLTRAVPLFLVAIAWIVTTRGGRIHIGFPGQIMIGGAAAAAVGLQTAGWPAALAVLGTALGGIAGGAAYAAIVAWMTEVRGVPGIISSLLLNLVAIGLVGWLLRGPMQGGVGAQPQTANFPPESLWPATSLVPGRALSWDIVLIPVLAATVVLFFARTTWGLRVSFAGASEQAARWAGLAPRASGAGVVIVSGALAGLAGAALLFAGRAPWMSEGFEADVGFTGIAVALLARNSPIGAIVTAVLFSSLGLGTTALQAQTGVPSTLSDVVQGTIIVLVLVSVAMLARPRSARPTRSRARDEAVAA